MSIASEISRLQSAKASIKTSIQGKGVTVPSSATLDDYPDYIDAISTGGATLITKTISTNGTYNATSDNADGYSQVTVNVSGGGVTEKLVNFIDYDGTVLYSYDATEFANLSALPANPSHAGLTSQGWNWTLADIKTQLTAIPEQTVYVGQMYVTDDGKTRLYCHFEENALSPTLGICPNGTVEVDWGDGSAVDTLTGTSTAVVKRVSHIYVSSGDYIITLSLISGSEYTIKGTSVWGAFILSSDTSGANANLYYANCLDRVELGISVDISSYAFYNCYSLQTITFPSFVTLTTYAFSGCSALQSATIPNGVTSIGTGVFSGCRALQNIAIPDGLASIGSSAFYGCYSLQNLIISGSATSIGNSAFANCVALQSIVIPDGITSIGNTAFQYCYALQSVTIPDSVTSIGNNAFQYCHALQSVNIPNGVTSIGIAFSSCYSLRNLTIPDSVTSIGNSAFANCYSMASYHFTSTTPPTLGTSVFKNINPDCKIYVPQASLEAYKTASNWSTYASHMVGE